MPTTHERFRRYESLRAALDLIDQGLTLIDDDLRFVAWNKPFMRLLGFPPEMGYVGAPFESFMRYNAERGEYGIGDPQPYIDERMRAARDFTAHEFERTRPDGTVLRVRGDAGAGPRLRDPLLGRHGTAGGRAPDPRAQRDAGIARGRTHRRASAQ